MSRIKRLVDGTRTGVRVVRRTKDSVGSFMIGPFFFLVGVAVAASLMDSLVLGVAVTLLVSCVVFSALYWRRSIPSVESMVTDSVAPDSVKDRILGRAEPAHRYTVYATSGIRKIGYVAAEAGSLYVEVESKGYYEVKTSMGDTLELDKGLLVSKLVATNKEGHSWRIPVARRVLWFVFPETNHEELSTLLGIFDSGPSIDDSPMPISFDDL